MLRVAACDDNRRILNQIEELVEDAVRDTYERAEVTQFISGEEFCARGELDTFNIILMDVEMGAINGIMAAEYLRKRNAHAKIIYISAYENYARKVFDVDPFDFLDKPIDEAQFKRVFLKACHKIRSDNDTFSYTFNKVTRRVLLRDILYFGSTAHLLSIHCADEKVISYYDKLDDVTVRLAAVDFIRINKSFLVNLRHVLEFRGSEAILSNEEVLKISRAYRESAFKAYLKYLERTSY